VVPVKQQQVPTCKFFEAGKCFKGDLCSFSHEVREPQSKQPTVSEDIECSICYHALGGTGKQFGLLDCCDHVFCLECIRQWKTARSTEDHTCPVCRETISLIIPSTIYAKGDHKKQIEELHRAKISSIPCRYFKFGNGRCPWGFECIYGHFNTDGTKAVTSYPPRNRSMHIDAMSDDRFFELLLSVMELMHHSSDVYGGRDYYSDRDSDSDSGSYDYF